LAAAREFWDSVDTEGTWLKCEDFSTVFITDSKLVKLLSMLITIPE
jgi:hypothetical protein